MWYIHKERKKESEVAQSCPTLCNPMDCSPPGSFVHGIFQARVWEWIAISSSRGSSRPRDRTQVSHIAGRHFTIWATREHNEILFCNKREWGTNTCYNMGESWKHYAKGKKPDTKDAILYDLIYMTCSEENSTETENRLVVAQGRGKNGRNEEWWWKVRIFFLGWWKCSEIRQCWWLHISVNIPKTTYLSTLKGDLFGMWIISQ